MTYQTLTKKLHKLGCEFVRQGSGSHEIWWNPKNKHFTVIPFHGNKDMSKGTVRSILRDLDIAPDEMAQA
jgi:predicted RNA binding protein YcfA (HicA-like mRNA interferase family)